MLNHLKEINDDDFINPHGFDSDLVLSTLEKYGYKNDSPIEEPEPVVSVCDETISTAGNITVFTGYKKTGKSAVFSAIIAGFMQNNPITDTLGFKPKYNSNSRAVIHIDTEQSRFNFDRFTRKNVLSRANLSSPPKWFYSLSLRETKINERMEILKNICAFVKKEHGGIHCVLIDGIADFVSSVNDEEDCNNVIHEFELMTIDYNTPLITVLHLNPGGNKSRGHLGSQLERKAESVLKMEKNPENGITSITEEALRNGGDMPIIEFSFNKSKGYHTFIGYESLKRKSKKATSFSDFEIETHYETLFEIIGEDGMSNDQLITELMRMLDVSNNAAKNILKEYKAQGMVIVEKRDMPYSLNYLMDAIIQKEKTKQSPF